MDMFLEPIAWLLVVLASLLGTLANLAFYELGKQGIEVVTSRFPRIKPERWHRTRGYFEDRGGWILLLSAVPGLGIVLVTASGVFGLQVAEFVLWFTIGRVLRNWLVLILAVEAYRSVV